MSLSLLTRARFIRLVGGKFIVVVDGGGEVVGLLQTCAVVHWDKIVAQGYNI